MKSQDLINGRHSHMRLACYLIPPLHISRHVETIRSTLGKLLNCQAALHFPVHMTLRGFFKPYAVYYDDVDAIVNSIEEVVARYSLPPLKLGDISIYLDAAIYVKVNCIDSFHNNILYQLKHDICYATEPFIEFSGSNHNDLQAPELSDILFPHFTLAFRDIPKNRMDLANEFVGSVIIKEIWTSGTKIQLLEFESDQWEEEWWKSLRFRIIKSWSI